MGLWALGAGAYGGERGFMVLEGGNLGQATCGCCSVVCGGELAGGGAGGWDAKVPLTDIKVVAT